MSANWLCSTLMSPPQSNTPAEPWMVLPAKMHHGDAGGAPSSSFLVGSPGVSPHRFRTVKALFVGLGLGEFVAFAQN